MLLYIILVEGRNPYFRFDVCQPIMFSLYQSQQQVRLHLYALEYGTNKKIYMFRINNNKNVIKGIM